MTWAMVERDIALLYCECMGAGVGLGSGKSFGLHAAIFDSVISIDARLDMISAALKWRSGILFDSTISSPDYVIEWKSLRGKIRKKYDKRNEIAHSDIIQRGMDNGSQLVRLAPFPTFTNTTFKTLLSLAELREREKIFSKLACDIVTFIDRIRALPKQPPISLKPLPNNRPDKTRAG